MLGPVSGIGYDWRDVWPQLRLLYGPEAWHECGLKLPGLQVDFERSVMLMLCWHDLSPVMSVAGIGAKYAEAMLLWL